MATAISDESLGRPLDKASKVKTTLVTRTDARRLWIRRRPAAAAAAALFLSFFSRFFFIGRLPFRSWLRLTNTKDDLTPFFCACGRRPCCCCCCC